MQHRSIGHAQCAVHGCWAVVLNQDMIKIELLGDTIDLHRPNHTGKPEVDRHASPVASFLAEPLCQGVNTAVDLGERSVEGRRDIGRPGFRFPSNADVNADAPPARDTPHPVQ